jgi:hypothetical protein
MKPAFAPRLRTRVSALQDAKAQTGRIVVASSTILGQDSVPMSYAIRENQAAFDERKRLNITPKKRRRGDDVGSQQEGRD